MSFKILERIDNFHCPEFRFLSNFYYSPFRIDGVIFPTVEHYYQSMKTLDDDEKRKIIEEPSPKKVKRMGKTVSLRKDWNKIKYSVMLTGVREKFFQNDVIKQKLIKTSPRFLEEGNYWHDNEWGNCRCMKCRNITGKNWLGIILMKVRDDFLGGKIR